MMNIKISNKIEYSLTPFQWKVLEVVMTIPLGETRTYAWVAKAIGKPGAVRAVGTALRKNPFPLIIPCHRVVKSNGHLGKYAGCADGRKKKLIEMEKFIKTQISKSQARLPACRNQGNLKDQTSRM